MGENKNKISGQNYYRDQEISLVDLIKILINRKWWFFSILTFILLSLIIIAYLKRPDNGRIKNKWVYTSYLSVGYISPNLLMEPLESTALIIKEVYAVQSQNQFPIDIEANKINGNIIKLKTIAGDGDDSSVLKYHRSLLMAVLQRHQTIQNEIREKDNQNKYITYYNILPSSIVSLAQKEALIPPKQNLKIYIFIGLIGGIIFGVIGVFIMESFINIWQEIKK